MHRHLSVFPLVLACLGLAGCGEGSISGFNTLSLMTSQVATVGCGNNLVSGTEECDGVDDSACPGRCSSQCACPATEIRANLEVHAIDVGQGDCLLIWSPAGFVMLVDSGTESNDANVISYLSSLGISDVDYTLVSHMHADHLGAMDRLIANFSSVVASFDSGRSATTGEYSEYNAAAGARRVTVGVGDTIDLGAGVSVDVLHANVNSSSENINSVVVRITHGATTFLLGGDCETECEDDLYPGQIDVYKVHHHGSYNGSSNLLLDRMNAHSALISVGDPNPYGHPHPEALSRLDAHGLVVYRTDHDGDLVVLSDGTNFSVNAPLICTNGQTRSCCPNDGDDCQPDNQTGTQTCSDGAWGPCVDLFPPNHLLISQVHYDTPGTDSEEEFVDIFNPTEEVVVLDGWTLSDDGGSWTFPSNLAIQPGTYMSVARQATGFSLLYGFDPDISGLSTALTNIGDRVTLRDPDNLDVDSVAWENYVSGWSIFAATGDSIERLEVSVDTNTVEDWSITSPAAPRGGGYAPSCFNHSDCDDGLFCNGTELCEAGACLAGTAVDCEDSISCTADHCNPTTDRCENLPNDLACDDDAWCNGAEICTPDVGCQSGTDPCPGKSCHEPGDRCVDCFTDAECADDVFCNGTEFCSNGTCMSGTPVDCADNITCTLDSCNPTTDRCENLPNDLACDDDAWCNGTEICTPDLGCQAGADPCPGKLCHEPGDRCVDCFTDADCADGVFCNGTETCSNGTCLSGTPVDCSGLDELCSTGVCNEAAQGCDLSPLPDGSFCDNGDGCGDDICLAGICEPASCSDHLLITQVHYDTPGTDSLREFADLFNPTAVDVDLTGWTLRDNLGSWTFPAGTILSAGSFLSVARNAAGFRSFYGLSADVSGLTLSLSNSGDRLALHDNSGTQIDHCAWAGTDGWSINAPSGTSMERMDLATDTDTQTDWQLRTPAQPMGGSFKMSPGPSIIYLPSRNFQYQIPVHPLPTLHPVNFP